MYFTKFLLIDRYPGISGAQSGNLKARKMVFHENEAIRRKDFYIMIIPLWFKIWYLVA